ncbi:MAG: hypothetical protein H3C35_06185 [Bacteroidetes bacterium]|nr:hypothetical protein [Bacteroidota bacterium]
MKKLFLCVILLVAAGCEDLDEDAPINFKKGIEFYKKGEYEIAEYYFDKIPEESPLYNSAQKRLQKIRELENEDPTERNPPPPTK